MREMDEASVDAIVTDPPYGLEFMGKEWDRFRVDDPGTARHRGERAGTHGELISVPDREPGAHPARNKSGVAYGGGKRPTTNRCVGCGKRDQFRNAHESCGEGEWRAELIDPHAAPPTMLAFQEWSRLWALEAKRILKPGGHLLAFGGTRTYHRLACAVEDAGFEIRDCLCWLYGSGFPKSLDVSKAIDRAAGAEREVVGSKLGQPGYSLVEDQGACGVAMEGNVDGSLRDAEAECAVTAPATPEAAQWQGWGTALKPAHEPIVLARKPLIGTVAQNCLTHGTGALNVDATRIGGDLGEMRGRSGVAVEGNRVLGRGIRNPTDEVWEPQDAGRWPANVTLDPEAAAMLDEQTGTLTSNSGEPFTRNSDKHRTTYGAFEGRRAEAGYYGDAGGASRFFYCAKSSTSERSAGLNGGRNIHPTCKPVSLMRWLARLVTPPGGTVLDPFTGSGTTGCAAVLEGFDFIGIEREAEYVAIAEARIAWWSEHQGREAEEVLADSRRSEVEREKHEASGQMGLLEPAA